MYKKIEAQLEELRALILNLGTSAKAEAQAPLATPVAKAETSKKSATSYWASKPGTTNSAAISALRSSTGTPLTVTIDGFAINGAVGEIYSNKAGTKCRALLVGDSGYATVRLTKAGRLPKVADVYFVGDEVATKVRFPA